LDGVNGLEKGCFKMTLGDRVDYFFTKYVRKTKADVPKTVEDSLLLPSKYGGQKEYKELSPEQCREYGTMSALFIKGTVKKNSDTFRAWFNLKRRDGIKMPNEEFDMIRLFEKRTQIKKKFKIAGMSADIWGDGYLLIKFAEPEADGEKSYSKLKREIPENAEPLDLILLNPECITEMYYPDTNNPEQIYYHYFNPKKNEDFPIYPDRILHVKTLELPNSNFGISKVQVLRNILISSADIDVATGEILKWFSHGIQILTKDGMQKAEKERALEMLREHPNFFAFNEKYHFDIKNPTAINPTPFYEHITEAISATLVVPRQILLGVQEGRVTGAEIGFADYYRDIKDNQDLVYTPLIERLYDYLGKAYDKDLSKYDACWNTTYIDELAEADVLGKRITAAVNARSPIKPIISIKEARRIISEGQIELDPEDVPKEELKQPLSPNGEKQIPKEGPNDNPKDIDRNIKPVKRETEKDIQDEWKQDMIDAYKEIKKFQIEKEKELGKQILKEQEENKDADS
jgi:hypothetical protein